MTEVSGDDGGDRLAVVINACQWQRAVGSGGRSVTVEQMLNLRPVVKGEWEDGTMP